MTSAVLRARTVILSNLPDGVTEQEMVTFMTHHMVSGESVIQHVLFPNIAGAVYVVFYAANAAMEAIDILHNKPFKDKSVDVRKISKTAEKDVEELIKGHKDKTLQNLITSLMVMPKEDMSKIADALNTVLTPTSERCETSTDPYYSNESFTVQRITSEVQVKN